MSLKQKVRKVLDEIQDKDKQINFDSPVAREYIADTIARELNKRSRTQYRQSDAGSLIF